MCRCGRGSVADSFVDNNEPSGSIKTGIFNQMSDYQCMACSKNGQFRIRARNHNKANMSWLSSATPFLATWSHPVSYSMGKKEALFPEVNQPKREVDYLPPSSDEIKYAWSYTYIPPYVLMAQSLIRNWDNFASSLHGSITQKVTTWITDTDYENVNWIFLTQDRYQYWALMLTFLSFGFHTTGKIRGLAAVLRYYAEGGGNCYAKI